MSGVEQEELDTYEVTVVGPGTRMERTIPAHVAFDVIERLMSAEAERSRRLSIQGFPEGDDLDAFLDDADAATNTKRIVATALFLRRQGVASFTRERIRA